MARKTPEKPKKANTTTASKKKTTTTKKQSLKKSRSSPARSRRGVVRKKTSLLPMVVPTEATILPVIVPSQVRQLPPKPARRVSAAPTWPPRFVSKLPTANPTPVSPHHHWPLLPIDDVKAYGALLLMTLIAVGLLLGFQRIPPVPVADSTVVVSALKPYISNDGYTISYPVGWTASTDEATQTTIFSRGNAKVTATLITNIDTTTLFPDTPTTATVDGLTALRYHDYDSATGQVLDRVAIPRPTGGYLEIRGYGPILDRMLTTVKFTTR